MALQLDVVSISYLLQVRGVEEGVTGGADWLPEAGAVVAVAGLTGAHRQLTFPPVRVPVMVQM